MEGWAGATWERVEKRHQEVREEGKREVRWV